MGTFAGFWGDMKNIPEDKREEFTQRAFTVLREGGMCCTTGAALFGKNICLLLPPEPDENGCVVVNYNVYDEDGWWEDACLDMRSCDFWSEKIGWMRFNVVVEAVYVLAEFYTEGLAWENDEVFDAGITIGWLNGLFGETYENTRLQDPERVLRLIPERARDRFDPSVCGGHGGPVPKRSTNEALGVTDDDRAHLWTPDGDVRFSREMQAWLGDMRALMDAIAGNAWETASGDAFLRGMAETLSRLKYPPYARMFYDFLAAPEDRRIQAIIRMLGGMAPSRHLVRLLAVLGNATLRAEVFGF